MASAYQTKANKEKASHDKASVGANKKADAAASSTVNTSAAGLGAYAKKFAKPTPRPTPTPDPSYISSPMESNLGKK